VVQGDGSKLKNPLGQSTGREKRWATQWNWREYTTKPVFGVNAGCQASTDQRLCASADIASEKFLHKGRTKRKQSQGNGRAFRSDVRAHFVARREASFYFLVYLHPSPSFASFVVKASAPDSSCRFSNHRPGANRTSQQGIHAHHD
jgi:hypothetical protein